MRLRLGLITGGQTAILAWCLAIAAGLGHGLWVSWSAGYWHEPWARLAALALADSVERGLLAGFFLALALGVLAGLNAALFNRRVAGFAAAIGATTAGGMTIVLATIKAFPGCSPTIALREWTAPIVEHLVADPLARAPFPALALTVLFGGALAGGGICALVCALLKRPRSQTVDWRWWQPASLVLALGVAAAMMNLPSFAAPDAKHPDVILIDIESLRADAVGALPSATPRLDELAAGAEVYRRAYAPCSWTLPSHVSLLTGLGPWRHGVETPMARLPENIVTLAERFAAAGYDTAAFVQSASIDPRHGFTQGFRRYTTMPQASGEAVADAASAWLAGRGKRPVFLLVHLSDPQWPYGRPDSSLPGVGAVDFAAFVTQALPAGEVERAAWRSQYLADVSLADQAAGKIFAAVRAAGRLEKAWVAVVGDHGEEFWDHGFLGHGVTLYEEVLRVPLMVKRPAPVTGSIIERPVSLLDLPATMASELSLPGNPAMDGLPLSFNGGASRDFLASSRLHGTPRFALIRDCSKGITDYQWRWGAFGGNSPPSFYDLCSDPVESANRYGTAVSQHWMSALFSWAGMAGGETSPAALDSCRLEMDS